MAPALRVVAKKPPLVVARRLFGMTKLHSSRLDWHFFSRNRGNQITINRPSKTPVVSVITGVFLCPK